MVNLDARTSQGKHATNLLNSNENSFEDSRIPPFIVSWTRIEFSRNARGFLELTDKAHVTTQETLRDKWCTKDNVQSKLSLAVICSGTCRVVN